jgi:hypothetical protein
LGHILGAEVERGSWRDYTSLEMAMKRAGDQFLPRKGRFMFLFFTE